MGIHYTFDIGLAQKYGVDEAIMLQNFIFWVSEERARSISDSPKKTWIYVSDRALINLFPFWDIDKIESVVYSLVDNDVILRKKELYAINNENYFLGDFSASDGYVKGYVYVVQCSENVYKIGCTRNPSRRFKEVNHIKVVFLHKSDQIFKDERKMHEKFESKRIEGEYFCLNNQDINFICDYFNKYYMKELEGADNVNGKAD